MIVMMTGILYWNLVFILKQQNHHTIKWFQAKRIPSIFLTNAVIPYKIPGGVPVRARARGGMDLRIYYLPAS
jgi:hypothetical protein